MKACSNEKCTEANPQPCGNFWKDARNASGMQSQCKTCKNHSNKRWFDSNPSKIAEYEASPERKARHKETTYAWREQNKDKYNEYMRNKNKEAYPEARLSRYGLTSSEFNLMLSYQGNVCALCGKANPSKKRTLAVDHSAITLEVRGVLCYGCNRAIAILDNPRLLAAATLYLSEHPAEKALGRKIIVPTKKAA